MTPRFRWSEEGTSARRARGWRCLRHAAYAATASEVLARLSLCLSGVQDVARTPSGAPIYQDPTLPVKILILVNAAVLAAWHLLIRSGNWHRTAAMFCHFSRPVDSSSAAREERPHTILTSGFFHMRVSHFLNNMIVLRVLSPYVVEDLGYRQFAYFYMGALYASSFFDDAVISRLPTTIVRPASRDVGMEKKLWNTMHSKLERFLRRLLQALFPRLATSVSIGASGAVCAVSIFRVLELRKTSLDALVAVLVMLLVSLDLVPLLYFREDDRVGHGAHLGGYAFGFLVWRLFPRSMKSSILGSDFNEISDWELGATVGLSILFCDEETENKKVDSKASRWFYQEFSSLSSPNYVSLTGGGGRRYLQDP